MKNLAAVEEDRSFFLGMAGIFVLVMLVGFGPTYFWRWSHPHALIAAPPEPFFYAIHGVLMTLWLLLVFLQSALIRWGLPKLHRQLGLLSSLLAIGVVGVGLEATHLAVVRSSGFFHGPPGALAFAINPLSDLLQFVPLFLAGLLMRRNRAAHQRLMLLASLVLLHPAVARCPLPVIQGARFWVDYPLADLALLLLLLPLLLYDGLTLKRVHPVTMLAGGLVVVVIAVRPLVDQSDLWLGMARVLTWS